MDNEEFLKGARGVADRREQDRQRAFAWDAKTFAEYASRHFNRKLETPDEMRRAFPAYIELREEGSEETPLYIPDTTVEKGRRYWGTDLTFEGFRAEVIRHMEPYITEERNVYRMCVHVVDEKDAESHSAEKRKAG